MFSDQCLLIRNADHSADELASTVRHGEFPRSAQHRQRGLAGTADEESIEGLFPEHHPSLKLGEVEGFREEPCAIFRHSPHVLIRNPDSGEQCNMLAVAAFAEERLNESGPVDIRHVKIRYDDVGTRGVRETGTMGLCKDGTRERVIVGQDRMALASQQATHRMQNYGIIINQDNLHWFLTCH